MKIKTLLLALLISTSLIGTAQALTFVNSSSNNSNTTSKVSTSDTKAFNELWESTKTKKIKVTKPFSHSLWTAENGYNELIGPHWTTYLRNNYNDGWQQVHMTDDMNSDGIVDFVYFPMFNIVNPNGSGTVSNDDLSDAEHGLCTDEVCVGFPVLPAIYFGRSDGTWILGTGAIIDNRKKPGYRWCRTPKLADFNGDGRSDIWCNDVIDDKGSGPNGVKEWNGQRDSYYLSQADGTWVESSDTHLSNPNFKTMNHDIAVGDIDNDGDVDVVMTTSGDDFKVGSYCWRNNDKGYMKLDKNCARGIKAIILELADMDGDGDLDLISLHEEDTSLPHQWFWGTTAIHYNNGRGQFRMDSVKLKEYGGKYDWNSGLSIKAADFDNDGDMDLIFSRHKKPYLGLAIEVKENLGNGKFGSDLQVIYDIPLEKHKKIKWEGTKWNVAQLLRLSDFNDDGLMDFTTYSGKGNRYSLDVYINNGDMTFSVIKKNDNNNPLERVHPFNRKSERVMFELDNFYMEDMH